MKQAAIVLRLLGSSTALVDYHTHAGTGSTGADAKVDHKEVLINQTRLPGKSALRQLLLLVRHAHKEALMPFDLSVVLQHALLCARTIRARISLIEHVDRLSRHAISTAASSVSTGFSSAQHGTAAAGTRGALLAQWLLCVRKARFRDAIAPTSIVSSSISPSDMFEYAWERYTIAAALTQSAGTVSAGVCTGPALSNDAAASAEATLAAVLRRFIKEYPRWYGVLVIVFQLVLSFRF